RVEILRFLFRLRKTSVQMLQSGLGQSIGKRSAFRIAELLDGMIDGLHAGREPQSGRRLARQIGIEHDRAWREQRMKIAFLRVSLSVGDACKGRELRRR